MKVHGPGVNNVGDNKNITDQDGNVLKLKEENTSLQKKISGKYQTEYSWIIIIINCPHNQSVNYRGQIFTN